MAKRKAAASRSRRGAVKRASGRARSGSRKAASAKASRTGARKATKTARKAAGGSKTAARTVSARKGPSTKLRASASTRLRASASTKLSASAPAARKAPKKVQARKAPALDRERRTVRDEDIVPTPPSSLDMDRTASAVRTGRKATRDRIGQHTETSPALTAGDVDADWESAYSTGDEAPGGDNPTPDQDVVDDIGKAVGVEYDDNEELKSEEKISKRDRNRWELDPASSEDYNDR